MYGILKAYLTEFETQLENWSIIGKDNSLYGQKKGLYLVENCIQKKLTNNISTKNLTHKPNEFTFFKTCQTKDFQ